MSVDVSIRKFFLMNGDLRTSYFRSRNRVYRSENLRPRLGGKERRGLGGGILLWNVCVEKVILEGYGHENEVDKGDGS